MHPLPHRLYVALVRGEAVTPQFAGKTLRLAENDMYAWSEASPTPWSMIPGACWSSIATAASTGRPAFASIIGVVGNQDGIAFRGSNVRASRKETFRVLDAEARQPILNGDSTPRVRRAIKRRLHPPVGHRP